MFQLPHLGIPGLGQHWSAVPPTVQFKDKAVEVQLGNSKGYSARLYYYMVSQPRPDVAAAREITAALRDKVRCVYVIGNTVQCTLKPRAAAYIRRITAS